MTYVAIPGMHSEERAASMRGNGYAPCLARRVDNCRTTQHAAFSDDPVGQHLASKRYDVSFDPTPEDLVQHIASDFRRKR